MHVLTSATSAARQKDWRAAAWWIECWLRAGTGGEFHTLAVELKLYSRRYRYAGTVDSALAVWLPPFISGKRAGTALLRGGDGMGP